MTDTTAPAAPQAIVALAADFPPADLTQWRRLIDKALKGADFDRRLVARTADGLRMEPLYTTRPPGAAGAMRVAGHGEVWDIRQIHAGVDPAATNAAILEDLAGGATSITLQIVPPTSGGFSFLDGGSLDSGSLDSGLARMLDGVMLDVCPVALKAADETPGAAAALIALWDARGVDAKNRLGAFNFDPYGTLAETGRRAEPMPVALSTAAGLVGRTRAWPGVTALCADGHVWHAAGASEAQELAAILGATVAYLKAAEGAGIAPAEALPKIAITLAVDADQLMGLAKLRAARRLLGRVAEACGAPEAASQMVFAAETSRAMMTRRDPWVNMLRTTMACATAAWGGADAITVLPFTWALGPPDAFASRMARNTSIVLMEESRLGRVSDPAAGSFAIETLTADLALKAWRLFQAMEAGGGLGVALASGQLQRAIAETAAHKRQAIATGRIALTGTSAFPRLGDDGVAVTPWPQQAARASRPEAVWVTPLAPFSPSAPFEALRDKADAFAARTGRPPQVYLACLGPQSAHAARATWMTNFLAAGGIAAVASAPILQSPDAGRGFGESGADVACLCGADDTYALLGEAVASLLKTAGARQVCLAGRPKGLEAGLTAAGVDRLIFTGCDMIETLTALQAALGVPEQIP